MACERDWTRREVLKFRPAAGGLVPGFGARSQPPPTTTPRARGSRADPPRERARGHPRLDDHECPDRSPDQVPQPLDRRIRFQDERTPRRIAFRSCKHQSRVTVHA